ncbi:MAG: type IV toxin-antitoxin system AbiEi family antitoxin domain-containing protein [Acidimicrobiales bacterium]
MQPLVPQAVIAHLAGHHGVITAEEARQLGLTDGQIRHRLRNGQWRSVHRGVYAVGGVGLTPEGTISAACAAGGQDPSRHTDRRRGCGG